MLADVIQGQFSHTSSKACRHYGNLIFPTTSCQASVVREHASEVGRRGIVHNGWIRQQLHAGPLQMLLELRYRHIHDCRRLECGTGHAPRVDTTSKSCRDAVHVPRSRNPRKHGSRYSLEHELILTWSHYLKAEHIGEATQTVRRMIPQRGTYNVPFFSTRQVCGITYKTPKTSMSAQVRVLLSVGSNTCSFDSGP